jgi:predicted transposase YbfD/YdcC
MRLPSQQLSEADMAGAVDSVPVRMKGFTKLFATLLGSRSAANRQHLLVDVVAISVCGVLARTDGPTAIFTWVDRAQHWLKKYLELPHGIPSADCIRRVLQRLQPETFQRSFAEWPNSLLGSSGAKFLSIDGKTLHRSHDEKHQLGALHLVSVWASEQGLTLGQIATTERSNEITAIPLLGDVKDAIVSIDVMSTQKAIAGKTIAKGGDCVLPAKDNQGNLEADVRTLLEGLWRMTSKARNSAGITQSKRIAQQWYYEINVPPKLRSLSQWKGLRTLGLAVQTRETGKVRHYISILKRSVKSFAKAGIENTCHWSLHMTFREDESRTRNRHVAENLAWLRRFTLGLLKQKALPCDETPHGRLESRLPR